MEECRRKVQNVLGGRGWSINQLPGGGRNGYFFALSGPNASQATADRPYTVVPLIDAGLYLYWCSLLLKFVPEGPEFNLQDASIIIFRGPAIDRDKEPILRAEWGCVAFYAAEEHAQPHWHAYPEGRDSFLWSRSDLETLETILEFGDDEDANMELGQEGLNDRFARLHLAMSALWQNGDTSMHRMEMTEEGVPAWIEGCLEYLRYQIRYTFGEPEEV